MGLVFNPFSGNFDFTGAGGDVHYISGTNDPTSVATSAVKGTVYVDLTTGFVYRKTDDGSTTNWVRMSDSTTAPGQVVTVGKSGCQYTTVTAALNAISDASITKQYLVLINPGVYSENVTAKSYVHMLGLGAGTAVTITANTTVLSGTVQDDAFTACSNITFLVTPTTDGQSAANVVGSIGYSDCFFVAQSSSDITMNCVTLQSNGGGVTAIKGGSATLINTYGGSTKNKTSVKIDSTGQTFVTAFSTRVTLSQLSGDYCGLNVSATATGELGVVNYGIFATNDVPGTSWNAVGACVYSTTTKNRVIGDSDWRFSSVSGGTFTAMLLNSASGTAQVFYEGMSVSQSGFTTAYMADTSITDTQKIWLNAPNSDMGKTGAGLAIITPYDELKSGFVEWGTGATYWSYNAGTRVFSVNKRVSGVVKSAPVIAASGQTATCTNYSTNYIYLNSTGALQVTTTTNEALYLNNIVLFEVYSDGTNYLVSKENHPYKFTSAISHAWHRLFGPLLEGTGAQITVLSASGRTINIVGADVLTDHGLDTTIPDSSGAAVNWTIAYTGPSGTTLVAAASGLPGQYNNGTTMSNTTDVVAYRLGVIKDSLNTSTPQYIARPHTATFANITAARTACNANSVALFDAPIKALEIVQLGFAIITASGSGVGTLNEVIVSKQTFAANFNAGAAASSAALVNTNTTNFNGALSSADTTVQLALDTLDNRLNQDLNTTSSPTFNGLSATGTLNVTGTSTLNGAVTVNNTINVTGTSSFAAINATGNASISGTLTVTGTSSLKAINAVGAANISGTLTVTGTSSLKAVDAVGNVNISGTLTATGAATLLSINTTASGTAAAPNITLNSDTNTGLFWKAADSIGFAASGVEVGSYSSAGLWTVGSASGNVAHQTIGKEAAVGTDGGEIIRFQARNTSTTTNKAALLIGGYSTGAGTAYAWIGSYENGTGGAGLKFASYTTEVGGYSAAGAWSMPLLSAGAGTYALKWTTTSGLLTYDTSFRGFKDNIRTSRYGLAAAMALQPREFEYKNDGRADVGFIADEVFEVIPELAPLIQEDFLLKNGSQELIPGGVSYDRITAVCIKAIQEQQAMILVLKAEIDALKAQLNV